MTEKKVRVTELEDVIRAMRDVEGARIVADNQGAIAEIHVLVRGERGAKQIVRDIESALMAKFGLKIDHKKVSIAQVSAAVVAPQKAAAANGKKPSVVPRLKLADIAMTFEGPLIKATVCLSHAGQIIEGFASGPNTPGNQLRIMALATARAVELAIQLPDSILIEEVTQVKLTGDRTAVNVMICLMCGRNEEHLLGAALSKQDTAKAAVLATLDAINRRFNVLKLEAGKLYPQGPGGNVETSVNGNRDNAEALKGEVSFPD